ncbi:MAG: hypothetical protein IJ446_09925 [Oscillospiraceae bacterium]|nr:hypothetical protein [Oscillospiraceae bacterium]
MAEYFGVRHLSPACAYYVTEFLERVKPEIVLIEGPSDLNELIAPLCSLETELPAAILAYTEKAPVRTVLWPYAEFSPEYRAMKWAVKNNKEVMFCDLPSSCLLSEDKDEENSEEKENNAPKSVSVYDALEKITGSDHYSFWEYTFEQCESYEDLIEAVSEYGKNLRENSEKDKHNQIREAYMRKLISECEKKASADKVAVITGAFHTYGIKNIPYTDEDKQLLSGLTKEKSKATLMPYSYYRLSSRSGYGAGSKAPAYFEILWKNRLSNTLKNSAPEYLSKIALYQRSNGYAASTAEVIEATRLAETLASMRGGKAPNLADLRDAAVTCMGHGSFGEISLACADTEIGTKIGSLPEGTVCTSVQEDFTRQLKELKLTKYRSASAEDIELDLRENLRVKTEKSAFLDLNRSFFLHRLRVLNIHFGELIPRHQDNATWAEAWRLQWSPEAEIEIVEASLQGDTVCGAAENILNFRLAESQSVSEAAAILSDVFMCGLSDCVKTAVMAVQRQAADCTSAADTGNAVGELSAIIRFGNLRRIDSEPVCPLLEKLFLRFCLSAETAAICDRAAATEIIGALSQINNACLSHDFLDEERFVRLLENLSDSEFANPLISGYACAVLTERGKISPEMLSALINRKLSKGTSASDGALWFEGLAKKNRRSLISRLSIWEKLCSFTQELDDEEFKSVLVCLRRTFSDFTPSEKSDIAENIGEVLGISKETAAEYITAAITEEQQQTLDELDDFDFGDI